VIASRGSSDFTARAGWVVFGAMSAQMVMGLAYVRGPLLPAVVAEFGWARGDLTLYGSGSIWMTALASPLAGFLTQRFGARPVAAFGAIWGGFMFWGFLGALAAGEILIRWGWRNAFLWVGLAMAAAILPIVLWTLHDPPSNYEPPSTVDDAPEGRDSRTRGGPTGVPLRVARRTASFWLLVIALFLFYFYFISVSAHLTLYLTDLGLSPRAVTLNFAFMIAIGVLSKLGIGMVADRWPPKTALLICFGFVTAASLLLIAVGVDKRLVPLFLVVHGIATMAQNVVYPLMVAHCFGTRYMAEIYGVIMLALLPGGTLGPIYAGYLFDWLGSYTIAFWTFVAAAGGSLVLLMFVRPVQPPAEQVTPGEPAGLEVL
jgi:predicted MFS family arabinose efflux permease